MTFLIVLAVIVFIFYYLLYKYIKESSVTYIFWLIFCGLLYIGSAFVLDISERMFSLMVGTGIIYFLLLFFVIIFHDDLVEKIKDFFK